MGLRTLSNAVLAMIVLNLIFVVLDLATYSTGTTELLSVIRNAKYSLLAETEIVGFKRIVGSFVEASSFGAATLGFFAYASKLWLLGVNRHRMAILSACSLVALVFSTSTTAYVGLGIFFTFCYLEACAQAALGRMTKQMALLIIGAPIAILVICLTIALNDATSAYVKNLADTMILNKMSTESGVERSMWNRQALQAFFNTYGFGVGNGSLRASSFPLAVLGNLGFVGAILFCLFFVGIFFNRAQFAKSHQIDDAYRQAAKSACIAWLITATISGALTDLGLPFFAFAAIACSRSLYPRAKPLTADIEGSYGLRTEAKLRPDLS
jgi:hypothetical protein